MTRRATFSEAGIPPGGGAVPALATVPLTDLHHLPAAVRTRGACLAHGARVLWDGLDLDIAQGEFVAILGSNGSGKTSLLKVLLGEQQLTRGRAWIAGEPVRRGSTAVGYVPQRVAIDEGHDDPGKGSRPHGAGRPPLGSADRPGGIPSRRADTDRCAAHLRRRG